MCLVTPELETLEDKKERERERERKEKEKYIFVSIKLWVGETWTRESWLGWSHFVSPASRVTTLHSSSTIQNTNTTTTTTTTNTDNDDNMKERFQCHIIIFVYIVHSYLLFIY